MKILEDNGISIGKKTASKVSFDNKVINDLITNYIAFDDCSQLFIESYAGKVPSPAFIALKNAVFEELDKFMSQSALEVGPCNW